MRILFSAARRKLNLYGSLISVMLVLLGFVVLAAQYLEPQSSAHVKESVPPPQLAGRIFIVNTTNDGVDTSPGDGLCDTDINTPGEQCSLRAAIMEANA